MKDLAIFPLPTGSIAVVALDNDGIPHLWDAQSGKWNAFITKPTVAFVKKKKTSVKKK